MNATEILVIILSIFLGIFLLCGIILAVLLIKVTIQIKKVTGSASRTAANVENLTGRISNITSAAFLGRLVKTQFKKARTKK